MRIGYARVSTRDQNLDLQVAALKAAGCEQIFTDKASGASADRKGLDAALSHSRQGDAFVVWKLDRLGRSVKHLVDFVGRLQERGIDFVSLTDGIDTATPAGRFFFHVMAALAEMERDLLRERTRAGLDAARDRGLVGGRRRALSEEGVESARQLLAAGRSPRSVADLLGISVPTLYRYVPAAASVVPDGAISARAAAAAEEEVAGDGDLGGAVGERE